MSEDFHRRGHHVQRAHGRRTSLATDGSHLNGGMIALMPTAADAKRLALPGGERAADLHCTLFFLGDDGAAWTEDQRNELEAAVRAQVQGMDPVPARIFGVAHWNGTGDGASWVWNTGDDPTVEDSPGLGTLRVLAGLALESTHDRPEIPQQHSPWAAHICAAYDSDLTLVRALEKRLGPVTFDRIRLSFGDDDRDIPFGDGALTAAGLRRDPLPCEDAVDFAEHNRQWENAVQLSTSRLVSVYSAWRVWMKEQITAGADTPEELTDLSLDSGQAAEILTEGMLDLARRAGASLQREAEKQGAAVPEWALPDDTVTAAVGGRRLLASVAKMSADLMASAVVQAAKRTVTGLFARDATPDQVAAEVDKVLADAQDGLLKGPVGTAMSTAQTAGRQAVLEAAPPGEYYASEMLDKNTCAPCRAVDGEQFGDLERAIKAYPVMGYKDCVGPRYGNACRGMIVARWAPEEEPVTAAGEAFHGSPGDPGYEALHPGRGPKGDLVENGNRVDKGDPLTYYRVDLPDADDPDQAEEDEDLFANYSADGYSDPVSHFLRTGESDPDEIYDDSELEDMRDAMDRIAERHVLAEPVSVYRIAPGSLYDGEEGDRVVDDAFLSTTVYKGITEKYRTNEDDVVIRIDVPKGAHVIPHRHLNPNASAKGEVILPRGLPLELKRREDGVLVYGPVLTDEGAEEVVEDPTSSVMDDSVTAAGEAFHGTLGDPGYSKLHPGGKGKRQENGVWLGSSKYSEEDQMDAFYSYTGGGFADMNNWLRSGEQSGASDADGESHALNDLIRIQDPLPEVKTLYRGIASFPTDLKKGDVFHDKGFVSTTDNAAISRDHFAGPKGGDGVIFAIHAPKGTKVLDAMKIGGYEEDSEFILPPGTRFRVKSVTISREDAKKYNMRASYTLEVVLDD